MPHPANPAKSVFVQAVELESPAARAALLDRVCGGDPALRQRVEALLGAYAEAGSFLDWPPAALASPAGLPATVGVSVLDALPDGAGRLPRVQLRDPAGEADAPVDRLYSPEVPDLPAAGGRYQLFGEIARGGMGAVLKGRDADLGREVAVKVLLEAHRGRAEHLWRFVEEAQVAGQLQHPNVVPVYDLGRLPDGRLFFAMKLVKGRTLAKLLAERSAPADDRPRFLKVFEQVCQAVAYAHNHGVIHRDLKPSNVMVGGFGEVQVMDWGLAKVLAAGGTADETQVRDASAVRTARGPGSTGGGGGSETRAGSILGTPAYMPPEQARGEVERLDERVDVFALGAILCEVLTGRPPHVGRAADEVCRRAAAGDLGPAFDGLDGCGTDGELVALAKRCLAAEPEDRWRDAGAVAAAVGAYLNGVQERLRAAEVGRAAARAREAEARATARAERRARRMTLGLAAAVLLVAGLGAAGWRLWDRQERARAERAAEAGLRESVVLQKAQRLPDGLAAARRARDLLGDAPDPDLRERVRGQVADLEMLNQLEELRYREFDALARDTDLAAQLDWHAAHARQYADAYRAYGIDVHGLGVDEAAARLRRSPIRADLATGLLEWMSHDFQDSGHLSEVFAKAETGSGSLVDRFVEADRKQDTAALLDLLSGTPAEDFPAGLLSKVHPDRRELGPAPGVLLRRAQAVYPNSFWANVLLGDYLYWNNDDLGAVACYRTALAVRPGSRRVLIMLGGCLQRTGRWPEAEELYREFAHRHPDDANVPRHLGTALRKQGRPAEAAADYRRALDRAAGRPEADWQVTLLLPLLGEALGEHGDWDGAAGAYQRAADLGEIPDHVRHYGAAPH
jgi:serine/threonine-protein kinase